MVTITHAHTVLIESQCRGRTHTHSFTIYIDHNTTTGPEENRYSPPPIGAPEGHTANATIPSQPGFYGAGERGWQRQ